MADLEYKGSSYYEMVWTTASGEEIPIKDMTDYHLINAKKWMDREGFEYLPEYDRVIDEMKRRNMHV